MKVIELKAQAYDTLAQIEMLQARLRQINQDIAKALEPAECNGVEVEDGKES